jgi:hypothetical protein
VLSVGTPCFHARMGRHTAVEGAAQHPLVSAAMAHRPGGGTHHAQRAGEGPVGWPGPEPTRDGGLGWPGPPHGSGGHDQPGEPAEEPQPPGPPRGWRRLLGGGRAA